MIPGLITRLSESLVVAAATISPLTDVIYVSGTTAIATINPSLGKTGPAQMLIIVPTNVAGVATLTTGNIALAVSLTTNLPVLFVYSKINNKWYPGAIS